MREELALRIGLTESRVQVSAASSLMLFSRARFFAREARNDVHLYDSEMSENCRVMTVFSKTRSRFSC